MILTHFRVLFSQHELTLTHKIITCLLISISESYGSILRPYFFFFLFQDDTGIRQVKTKTLRIHFKLFLRAKINK